MRPIQKFGDPTVPTRRQLVSSVFGVAVELAVALAAIGARAAEPEAGSPPTLEAETRKRFEQLLGEIKKLESESDVRNAKDLEKVSAEINKLKFENESKNAAELEKLSAEIVKLKFENGPLGRWLGAVVIPFGIGALGFAASLIAARWTIRSERRKTLEQINAMAGQETHKKRLDCYAEVMKAMSPLALFFPDDHKLDRFRCLQIGKALSNWYYTTGGLFLSVEVREEYFRLMRALTKASLSDTILAPDWNQYAESINDRTMGEYRKLLNLSIEKWDGNTEEEKTKTAVDRWEFGKKWSQDEKQKLKEWYLLQKIGALPQAERGKLEVQSELMAELKLNRQNR
jgi:hypothetical protein